MQFNDTLGAALLGAFFTCILYGITCLQCFIFLRYAKKTERRLISSVWCLWLLDTVHLVFVMHAVYWYTVINFTNVEVLGLVPWSIPAGILLTPTSDTIVRCWFTYRVWILSKKMRWLTYPLIFLVFVIWVIGIAFGVRAFALNTFVKFSELAWLMYLGLGLLVFVDLYVAVSLCFFLFRSRHQVNRQTNSLINFLLVYTINTGLVTSIFSLACFITYAAMPDNYVFLAMYFPLSKLYINALLASLNARDELKGGSQVVSIPLTNPMTLSRPIFVGVPPSVDMDRSTGTGTDSETLRMRLDDGKQGGGA